MAHALCVVNKKATPAHARTPTPTHTHSNTLGICNIYYFSTTVVTPTLVSYTFIVHCLSCICFSVEPIVLFDICVQAMLSAWSSHAVFRRSLFSEMRHRYQTRRRYLQEDYSKGRFTLSMPCPCRSPAMPCR